MSSVIIFFSFMLLTSLTSIFGISINGMSINRIFNEMPLAIVQASINKIDGDGNFNPHYNKSILEKNVTNYLVKSLDGYTDSFRIGFTYYKVNENNELIVDVTSYPVNVDIHFQCEYSTYLTFDGYRSFEIIRKDI